VAVLTQTEIQAQMQLARQGKVTRARRAFFPVTRLAEAEAARVRRAVALAAALEFKFQLRAQLLILAAVEVVGAQAVPA
jgi:hypothetical protein